MDGCHVWIIPDEADMRGSLGMPKMLERNQADRVLRNGAGEALMLMRCFTVSIPAGQRR